LDAYIAAHNGADNFFVILAQLFLLFYFFKNISYHQFQTALGIQQVRWMNDTANNRTMTRYRIAGVTPFLWDSIDTESKTQILKEFAPHFERKSISAFRIEDFDSHLTNTIWYEVNQPGFGRGMWSGFNAKQDKHWYTIPETFYYPNACTYRPILQFGTVNEKTLLYFIIENKLRPYAAHLPDSKSNLRHIHSVDHAIVQNWRHDFSHSNGISDCDLDKTLRFLNARCKPKTPFTKDNLLHNEELDNCIDEKRVRPGAITNTGMILHNF
jgi:hypothetical protein